MCDFSVDLGDPALFEYWGRMLKRAKVYGWVYGSHRAVPLVFSFGGEGWMARSVDDIEGLPVTWGLLGAGFVLGGW